MHLHFLRSPKNLTFFFLVTLSWSILRPVHFFFRNLSITHTKQQNSAWARLCCHWLPLSVKPRPRRPITPQQHQNNQPSTCLTCLMLHSLHSQPQHCRIKVLGSIAWTSLEIKVTLNSVQKNRLNLSVAYVTSRVTFTQSTFRQTYCSPAQCLCH